MNKRMREIMTTIGEKEAEARKILDAKGEDAVIKAGAILDEIAVLEKEYEVEKALFDRHKDEVPNDGKPPKGSDPVADFGKAAKGGFKVKTNDYDDTMNTQVDADGGYTVPEDIQTRVETLREATFSLLTLVRRVPVRTQSGARTFKKRSQHTGFSKVGEASAIGATSAPEFERITYNIDKYAGYLPVTNELRYDSDANVGQIVIDWLAEESRATANKLILNVIKGAGEEVDFENIDGIKKALNVTLGSAFRNTSVIVTNDDGLQYLDTLKRKTGSNEYLLTPNVDGKMTLRLAVGGTTVPIEVVPNSVMPSTPTYTASDDTSVKSGVTYYTRSGAGTTADPYVYTAVASPTGNPSTSSYYEMDATPKIPFIVGDLKEGVVYWDRQRTSIAESAIASIGSFNAFEQDLTLYRAIEREDVTVRDSEAFVYGFIQPAA